MAVNRISAGRSKVRYFVVLPSGMTSFARNIALDQKWIRRKLAGASPFSRPENHSTLISQVQPADRITARAKEATGCQGRQAVLNPSAEGTESLNEIVLVSLHVKILPTRCR